MIDIPSTEFRKSYAQLKVPTAVTVNGHAVGIWLPGDELVKALERAQRCEFCGQAAVVHHAVNCTDPEFLAEPKPTRASSQAQRDELLRKINRRG